MQPRKTKVDDQARTCPGCGYPTARLTRLDHYLSLFFIPLIPMKRGERFLECSRCGAVFDEGGKPQPSTFRERSGRTCPRCGGEVTPEFQFCPYCGQRMS